MDLDWIVSLAAVLVSLVTVIISHFTNKENLKHASENMMTERDIDFKVSLWNEIINLCDELVIVTNSDHLEQCVNITVAGKKNDISDEEILNKLNSNCETIHSLMFKLCLKIKSLDPENARLLDDIRAYAKSVVALYKNMQEFYLDDNATREQYNDIVTRVAEFSEKGLEFSHKMQDYISTLQEKLFNGNRRKNN